jgi:epoxyqueuosine reductase
MEGAALKERLRAAALEAGFDAFGVAPVPAEVRADYFHKWIKDGMHGDMAWLARNPERRTNPSQVLPEARSVIVLGANYWQPAPVRDFRIATYALGEDYHDLLLQRLERVCAVMHAAGGAQKPYVDTGPVLEKPFAAAAGLGWQGKNTLLIHRKHGTWLLLGVILTTLDLPPDAAEPDHCGSCTRCQDVCPTKAFPAPYQLDARRCLSYLTIEHKGPIPLEFREALGDRVFGCDECLTVCPWNRWAQVTKEQRFAAREVPPLRETLGWDQASFDACFAGTPIKRLGLERWLRNALTVLGNVGTAMDLPAVNRLLAHPDPMVAEHAAWAAPRIKARSTRS